MKLKRPRLEINERQQLILGILLIVLLAISMLYCLGLASLVARETWKNAPLPWSNTELLEENLDLAATPFPAQPSPGVTVP